MSAENKIMEVNLRHFFALLSWWQALLLAALFSLVVLLFTPFAVSAKFYANMMELSSFFAIFLFKKFNIVSGKLSFENNGVYLTDKRGRSKRVYLHFPDKKTQKLSSNMIHAFKKKKLNLCFHGGVQQDEYKTAMLCGSVVSATSAAMPLIKSEYKTNMHTSVLKTTNDDVLTLTFDFVARTSLIVILLNLMRR